MNKPYNYWYKHPGVFRIYLGFIYDSFHLDYNTRMTELVYRVHYDSGLYFLNKNEITIRNIDKYIFYKK